MDCLLFDCDGALVDSEGLGSVGLVVLFRELGAELDADELVARCQRLSRRFVAAIFLIISEKI